MNIRKSQDRRGLLNRLFTGWFANEEARLRYATVDAELDGRGTDAFRYSVLRDEHLSKAAA